MVHQKDRQQSSSAPIVHVDRLNNKLKVELPIAKDSHRYNNGETGSCYLAAFCVLIDLHRKGIEATLCHGVVTCTGTDNLGDRICHAWIEVETQVEIDGLPASLTMVIDAANPDNPVSIMPFEYYYMGGMINPDTVRRYTKEQMLFASLLLDHVGPFERPMEPTIDIDMDDCPLLPEGFDWSINEDQASN